MKQLNWLWCCVFIFLELFVSYSQPLSCTPVSFFNQYTLTPRPPAETIPSGCMEFAGLPFQCGQSSPLLNRNKGSEENPMNNEIHSWNSSLSPSVTIEFTQNRGTPPPITIRHFNLFFYHTPSMGIGLPDVQLKGVVRLSGTRTPLPYLITGNQDLSKDDDRRRNITLSVLSPSGYDRYELTFDFNVNLNGISEMLLSEIELCGSPPSVEAPTTAPSLSPSPAIVLDADNVTSNLSLSCTVAGEGRFRWQWTDAGRNSLNPEVTFSDTTRTNTALFTRIKSGNTFRCVATYYPAIPGASFPMRASQEISVEFPRELVAVGPTMKSAKLGDNVTFSCEIFGYFGEVIPDIGWTPPFGDPDPNDITITNGNNSIQNGGAEPRDSIISTLSLFISDSSFSGPYVCNQGGVTHVRVFSLGIDTTITPPMMTTKATTATATTATATTATTPRMMTPSPDQSTTIIIVIASVAGGLVVIILLILITIICIFIIRKKHKSLRLNETHRKDSLDYDGEPFYQEVCKPAPPPLPDHFPRLSPEIEAYATVSNTQRPPNGHLEMKEKKNDDRWVKTSSLLVSTEPVNRSSLHADQMPFLESNPLYASSDTLDNCEKNRRMGSVPSLDVLTGSPNGSQLNIYAQPSRVIPPIPNRPDTPELLDDATFNESDIDPTVFKTNRSSELEGEGLPCISIYDDPNPLLRSEGPKEITQENIQEIRNLGVGQFGQVILAKTVGLSLKDLKLSNEDDDKGISIEVAVKGLKSAAEPYVKEAFEKEIKFMSRLRNENVIRLLAICPNNNPFIVMEYMENGDLNQYLRHHKLATIKSTPKKKQLSRQQLTFITLQIASGMKYLASFKFIHRDLATRNCLVGNDLKIKIADFGMSRSLYSSYYYRISGRAMLPIRWMANECFYGKFSEKTDVWAFGVTMWEVFTFAREQPYQDMTDQEVIDDAIKGPDRMLLPKPECCPPEVYEVMKRCWIDEPSERARFKDAHSLLEAIYKFGDFQ